MSRPDRNIADRSYLKGKIYSAFSQACSYHLTHADLLDLLTRSVYSNYRYKRLPQRERAYLSGVSETLHAALHENRDIFGNSPLLEWRVLLDGEFVTPDNVPVGRWADVTSGGGRHFWRGTDRPF